MPERDGSAGAPFAAGAVRRHYAALAPEYASRANRSCARAYAALVERTLGGCLKVVEVGIGSSAGSPARAGVTLIACDLSLPMLLAGRSSNPRHFASAGQELPLPDASADGFLSINLLEHLPDPAALVGEAARVLSPGGRFLAVTPNGDRARLLGLLERLRMKLPEGPHRFLRFPEMAELGGLAGTAFRTLEHRRFLALPLGPERLVRAVDDLVGERNGLFQYLLLEKRSDSSPGGCG